MSNLFCSYLLVFVLGCLGVRGDRLSTSARNDPQLSFNSLNDLQRSLKVQQRRFRNSATDAVLQTKVKGDKGIVIAAGGRRLLTNAYVVAKSVRDVLNSTLPIEVFYYSNEEADLAIFKKLKEIIGVTIQDASLLPQPALLSPWPPSLHAFARKVFSLYITGFKEVLLLDSDNQPLIQPEELFQLAAYKKHGAVFWPDYWKANSALEAPKRGAYAALGLEVPWKDKPTWACVESGQVLFNKVQHMDVLNWVMWINQWADVMYEYVLGDKDTFEMGFMLAKKHDHFYRMPVPPRTALTQKLQAAHVYLHVGIVQCIDGRPAFLHRTSGGKFDLEKASGRHLRPAFLTEPMSVQAAKKFVWDTKAAINVLPAASVAPGLPHCKDISQLTLAALNATVTAQKVRRNMLPIAKGYTQCSVYHQGDIAFPIPLLPMAIFGSKIMQAVTHSYAAFAHLRQSLRLNLTAGVQSA